MKAVVAAFNQEKALVGAFSVIVQFCRLIVYSTSSYPDWGSVCRYDHDQNSTFAGPGHGSVVRDTRGDWWLVYHGWR